MINTNFASTMSHHNPERLGLKKILVIMVI